MVIVRTDDLARKLRFTYLGPAPYRWPTATIPQWLAMFAVALPSTAALIAVLVWLQLGITATVGGVAIFTPALLFLEWRLVKALFEHVDTERPVRYWLRLLIGEIRAPRPPADDETTHTFTVTPDLWKDRP